MLIIEAVVKDDGLNGEDPGMKMRTFSHSRIKMKDVRLATFSNGPQDGLRTRHLIEDLAEVRFWYWFYGTTHSQGFGNLRKVGVCTLNTMGNTGKHVIFFKNRSIPLLCIISHVIS